MRTELEGGEAPRSTERHQEASSRQNTHNPPSMASQLSDTKQEPEILSEGTGGKLANTGPDTGRWCLYIIAGRMGYDLPFAVLGAILNAVGCGLPSSLSPTTPTSEWAGYQALTRFGRGAAMQAPMIAVQNAVLPDDMSTAMAILTFYQTFGASVFFAVAEVLFSHGLRSTIPQYAPTVDPKTVIAAAATGFQGIMSKASLPGVLLAYSKSLGHVVYLVAALSVVQFFFAWGMGWKNVGKPKEDKLKREEEGE